MSTRWLCAIGLVASLVGVASARANEQQLWRYPCDVMLPEACFRLPNGMSVTYEVPADSGIYAVQQAGKDVVTLYAGQAPDRSKFSGAPVLVLDSRAHRLEVFVTPDEGRLRMDLLISPKKKGGALVHAFGFIDRGNATAIAYALSGLRPCTRQARESTRCSTESSWGEELSTLIRSSGSLASQ